MGIDRLNALMGKDKSDDIQYIKPNKLMSYSLNPFKKYDGERRENLKQSIINNGVINPVIVVSNLFDNSYTIICGHNRADICKELNMDVPCIVRDDLAPEEQTLLMLESNLNQRSIDDMLPSELSKALLMRNNALKQAKKSWVQLEPQQRLSEQIGDEYKLSASSVKRYIRIGQYLTEELMELLDNKEIGLTTAVNLSHMAKEAQIMLAEQVNTNKYRVSLNASEKLKETSDITIEYIQELLSPTKSNDKPIKFTKKKLLKYIPEDDISRAEEIIINALKQYYA